ncbi:MAG TPA: MlaD family protein, partial [Polyangiaceae bacterium]|nr:MlaD family protein [Polyangiaceae bacterium]
MTTPSEPTGSTPVAGLKRLRHVSPMWLTPVVALAVLVYLLVTTLARRGPVVTISFESAEGLSTGQTQVTHRDVALGTVEDIRLSDDLSRVVVSVRMSAKARSLLTDHARFWVVRPQLTAGSIGKALETLVAGAHIEIDPGPPGGHPKLHFEGLSRPPGVTSDQPGRTFVLDATNVEPPAVGAPVMYRRVTVGEVLSSHLESADGPFEIRIFVRAPYDAFVHPGTRFWAEAGISVETGARGLRVDLAPLQELFSGGIAFETRPEHERSAPSEPDAAFALYRDKTSADAASFSRHVRCVSYFPASIQGLDRGSVVEIFGFTVGVVTDTRLVADADHPGQLLVRVGFDLQPERLGDQGSASALSPDGLAQLVRGGLRAGLDSRSFVTGEKEVALAYVPGTKPAAVGAEGDALVLPAEPGAGGDVTDAIRGVATKLDRIPFESIGADLQATLRSVDRTARRMPDISDQLEQAARHVNEALGQTGYGQDSEFQRNV